MCALFELIHVTPRLVASFEIGGRWLGRERQLEQQWPIHGIGCGQHQLQMFLVLLEIRALKAHHAIGTSSRRQLLLGEAELMNSYLIRQNLLRLSVLRVV